MQVVLEKLLGKAKCIQHFETLAKNISIYGHAGIKVDWDWDFDTVTYLAQVPVINSEGMQVVQPVMTPQGPIMQPVTRPQLAQKQVPRNCPKLIPIDVYDLLVDPDGGVVAHLTEKPMGQMKREQAVSMQVAQQDPSKQPLYDPQAFQLLVQKVSQAKTKDPDGVLIRLAELWDEAAQTQTVITFGEDAEAVSYKDLRASYRSASYSPYKREVYGGAAVTLYHGPIPFNHKKAPILHTSFIKLPNEVYGLGAVEIISDLTESINKFVNMITDNWNLGINRRYAYDVNADIDHVALNSFNVPGGKVGVNGDPSKTIMPLPFFTPQAGDYEVLEVYKGMIEMTSGVSDFYAKASGSPTGNKTATGINSIINESNFRFKLFIRNLELDILQPLLAMCASLVQQYLSDPVEVQITGENPAIKKWVSMTPEELVGTLDFELVAANYATNKMIRQRNLMALVNVLSESPYVNQYEAIKELLKTFEIRDVNELLYTPQQVQQQQAAQQDHQIKLMMLEAALQTESKARLSQVKPTTSKDKGGRPRTTQFEGKIPGAGLTTHIRELAQAAGANAMGLEGIE